MTTTQQNPLSIEGYRPRMTEDEFETWVLREGVRAEWVEGEVVLMSPVSFEHWELVNWLVTLMRMHAKKHHLGTVGGTDFLAKLAERRRLPDVFFVRTGSPSVFKRTYLEGPPDLIVEVVLPDSESRDWRVKYLEYQAAGVREYWVIDPASSHAEFYVLRDGQYAPIPVSDGTIRSETLAGFWLKIEWLWDRPLPNDYEIAKILGIV